MAVIRSGADRIRLATTGADVIRCQQLRYLTFIKKRGLDDGSEAGPKAGRLYHDKFDTICQHIMVENARSGALVCCFRILLLRNAREISRSYVAQHYELSNLAAYPGPIVEIGRFCIHPAYRIPGVLRAAWCAVIRLVDQEEITLLFGCSSFHGVDVWPHQDAFALLRQNHPAPNRWLPRVKSPSVFRFACKDQFGQPDRKQALRCMPPLLRSYLGMGGWASGHVEIDNQLNTQHVFTGIEIDMMRPDRTRQLRRVGTGA